MTNNQSNELREEIATLSVDGHQLQNYLGSQHVDMLVEYIQDRERQARIETIADVKKAGYGYDDGTGFVLKISYKELGQLKGDKS